MRFGEVRRPERQRGLELDQRRLPAGLLHEPAAELDVRGRVERIEVGNQPERVVPIV